MGILTFQILSAALTFVTSIFVPLRYGHALVLGKVFCVGQMVEEPLNGVGEVA